MKTYLVTWSIDLEAESPEDAARQALDIQRDPDSCALVFGVREPGKRLVRVDLWEGEDA